MGRWLTPDSIEYLEAESINGLNLYAYAKNNPIMYADPSGHSAILVTLLIGIGIGAAIGGAFAGYNAYKDGERGWELFWDITGGALIGGALGAASSLGGLVGVGAISGWAAVGAFTLSTLTSFGAGVGGYWLQNYSNNDFSYEEMFKQGGLTALQSMFNFGLGVVYGASGNWSNIGDGTFSKFMNEFSAVSKNGFTTFCKSILMYGKEFGVQMIERAGIRSSIWWLLNQF